MHPFRDFKCQGCGVTWRRRFAETPKHCFACEDKLTRKAAPVVIEALSPSAIAVLHQLFKTGPTWDGNIISKPGRGELFKAGYSDRVDGFAFLTSQGVALAASVYGTEKI